MWPGSQGLGTPLGNGYEVVVDVAKTVAGVTIKPTKNEVENFMIRESCCIVQKRKLRS